jgi:serine protease Do
MTRNSRLLDFSAIFFFAWAHATAQEVSPLQRLNDSLVSLSKRLTPAVVQVLSDGFQPVPGGAPLPLHAMERACGSGVVLSQDGYIITNAHVIEGSSRVQVQLSAAQTQEGRSKQTGTVTLPAEVVGRDKETDLALLKVKAAGLPFLELADSDTVKQGQLVFALGNPAGLESSITMGTVSAIARQLEPDDTVAYLQTDAPINPGNSGGPLIDVDGKVIGINTLIMSRSGGSEGLGFAVPSNLVRFVSDRLRKHGVVVRGDIGVEAQTITPALAAGLNLPVKSGVILADVVPDGAGSMARLRPGDIVLSLNGNAVVTAREFQLDLNQEELLSFVTLELLRNGERVSQRVRILERADTFERFSSLVRERQRLIDRLAVLGFDLDPKLLREMPVLTRRDNGVLVAGLALSPYGPSGDLLPGDVIFAVNRQTICTLEDLNHTLEPFAPGSTVILQVERGGKLRFLEIALK